MTTKHHEQDSIISAKARAAQIRAESERIERQQAEAAEHQKAHRAKQDAEIQRQADEDLNRAAASISEIESREQLLGEIRRMREDKPEEPPPVVHRTERMIQELNAEQEAGRAAVAKAEAEQQRNRELVARIAEEERQRLGTMQPVHHPNPSQDEQYPASGATLGKKK